MEYFEDINFLNVFLINEYLFLMIQARKRIMSLIEKEIGERRRGIGAFQEDFLGRLLAEDDKAQSDATITRLSDAEIKDNILTMIIAGQP